MRHTRVSEVVLEFDKNYIRDLMNAPSTNAEQLRTIKTALRSVMEEELSDRQRQIIEMHYFQGMNNAQIARALHLNPSTVGRTRKRAEHNIYRTLRFFFIHGWDGAIRTHD